MKINQILLTIHQTPFCCSCKNHKNMALSILTFTATVTQPVTNKNNCGAIKDIKIGTYCLLLVTYCVLTFYIPIPLKKYKLTYWYVLIYDYLFYFALVYIGSTCFKVGLLETPVCHIYTCRQIANKFKVHDLRKICWFFPFLQE